MKNFIRIQTLDRLRKLTAAVRELRHDPENAKCLHDVRVASRRLQQCLRIFAPFMGEGKGKVILRRLRRLMDSCGAVRNCDIAIELLEKLGIHNPELVAKITKERQQNEVKLRDRLERWRGKRGLKKWRDKLEFKAAKDGSEENIRRSPTEMAVQLFAAGNAAAASKDHTSMHRFRLLGKRFRYTLELFEESYGSETEVYLKAMRDLQDRLGDINDCVTARPWMTDSPQAAVALEHLLEKRERAFQLYWRKMSKSRDSWVRWLGERQDGHLRSTARRGGTA